MDLLIFVSVGILTCHSKENTITHQEMATQYHFSFSVALLTSHHLLLRLTLEQRGETEDIVVIRVEVKSIVAADTRGEAGSPAGLPGLCDRILDCPISQPAGIAPVHSLFPTLEELCDGGHCRVLLLTGLLGPQEAQMVTTMRVLVGKHHTWVEDSIRHQNIYVDFKVCQAFTAIVISSIVATLLTK